MQPVPNRAWKTMVFNAADLTFDTCIDAFPGGPPVSQDRFGICCNMSSFFRRFRGSEMRIVFNSSAIPSYIALFGAFIFDLWIPLGYAEWVLYVFPPFMIPVTLHGKLIPFTATLTTLLMIIGFVFSPRSTIPLTTAMVQRGAGIAALCIVSVLLLRRARIYRALSESERRFKLAVDNYVSAFIIYDKERRIQYVNRAGLEVSGVSQEEVLGHTDEELMPKELVDKYIPYLKKAISEKTPQHHEFKFTLKARNFTYTIDYIPLLDETGEIEQVLAITFDITDRKKNEEEIRRKSAELEATINSLPDGYILYGIDGSIRRMNPTARDMLGYTKEEMERPFLERIRALNIITPNGAPFPPERFPSNRALQGEIVRDEILRIQRRDKYFWLSISASPITMNDGTVLGVVLEFAEVTALRDLQERLRQERNFVNAILQTSGALIAVLDAEARFVRFNTACEQLSGYSEDEIRGKSLFEVLIPDEEHRYVESVASRMRAGESLIENENHWVTKSGEKRYIRWRNSVLHDDMGNDYAIATGIDITDRKHLQEELQRRAEELIAANEGLESFSYSVSHDLRAPLRSIEAFSNFLLEDYRDKLDKTAWDYLTRISSGVGRMKTLIDDLLNLSRISRQDLIRGDIDLSRIAVDFVAELRSTNQNRSIEVTIEDDLRVNGDASLLYLAISNLIRNAWKYTCGVEHPKIEVGKMHEDNRKVFYVRDNGVGFDMRYADKLFIPFQRLHSQGEFRGTGIGLPIVQRVIRRHGGQIWAESEVGKGTTFYFTLE